MNSGMWHCDNDDVKRNIAMMGVIKSSLYMSIRKAYTPDPALDRLEKNDIKFANIMMICVKVRQLWRH
jgi:hypothetical protein